MWAVFWKGKSLNRCTCCHEDMYNTRQWIVLNMPSSIALQQTQLWRQSEWRFRSTVRVKHESAYGHNLPRAYWILPNARFNQKTKVYLKFQRGKITETSAAMLTQCAAARSCRACGSSRSVPAPCSRCRDSWAQSPARRTACERRPAWCRQTSASRWLSAGATVPADQWPRSFFITHLLLATSSWPSS